MKPEEADQLRALAAKLMELSREESQRLMFSEPPEIGAPAELFDDQETRWSDLSLYRAAHSENTRRKLRKKFLPADWFSEGPWNILIDLFEHEHAGKDVSITSACIAADVPPTTALRHIAQLVEAGMIRRFSDPKDNRRSFLRMTHRGSRVMRDVLGTMIDAEIAVAERIGRQEKLPGKAS